MSVCLKFLRLNDDATRPKQGYALSAGLDLYSAVDIVVPFHGKALVDTSIMIAQFPRNTYGRIAPRSGLSYYHFIDVGAGVIDPDYRGSIKVLLFNYSDKNFQVKKGDAIAQLICEKFVKPTVVEIFDDELLNVELENVDRDRQRGSNCFGSTGGIFNMLCS
jgi:dUTP pyrophosphatase